MRKAGDDPDAAVAAVRGVAGASSGASVEVLHRANNVVARIGDAVAKVMMADDSAALREFELALHGSRFGAPVLRPLREPDVVGDYVITWWPFIESRGEDADPAALSAALRSFHGVMGSTDVKLRTPEEDARSLLDLALDEGATAAMPEVARSVIVPVLERATHLRTPRDAPVVHGDVHSGNYLVTQDGVVLIDLEGVKRAPVEYDLAFLSEEAVKQYWPEHDAAVLSTFRLLLSAGVAALCWRHATSRPEDDHHRWHAEHHAAVLLTED